MGFRPKSARHNRMNWKEDMPPQSLRIEVSEAIEAAGTGAALARELGITRAAVYQWRPPYRHDPYMPIKMAARFLENKTLRAALRKIRK